MPKLHDAILAAERRLREHLVATPLRESLNLPERGVFLKLENLQPGGSFKLRGALNKLLCMSAGERERGVVAASSGNHGIGVAYGLRILRGHGLIFVPEGTAQGKLDAIASLGAEVRIHGADCVFTEVHARRHAEHHGMTYLSPYNDLQVIAGQGTIGVEIAQQIGAVDAVYVALGGGGLVAGIGAFLKVARPGVEVIACSPANSPVMHESVRAGHIVEMTCRPTLSDSTAGGVEAGALTFDLCRRAVDRYLLADEEEIAAGIRLFLTKEHLLIEGAAAVAVAGYLQESERWRGKRVAIIICGANISLQQLRQVLGGTGDT